MENTVMLSPYEEVQRFIMEHYSPEYQTTLLDAMAVFQAYGMVNMPHELMNLIYAPEMEDDELAHQAFDQYVIDALDDLLESHGIILLEAKLRDQLEVIKGLSHVVQTSDPVPFMRIIELNTLPNEDKLARILSSFSLKDESYFMTLLASVEEDLLIERLYVKLEEIEEKNTIEKEPDPVLSEREKMVPYFKKFVEKFGNETVGTAILDLGMQLGLPIQTYLAYFGDQIDYTHPEAASLDLLSIFTIAIDTWKRPMEAYREMSEVLVKDTRNIPVIETQMGKLNESLIQYAKELS